MKFGAKNDDKEPSGRNSAHFPICTAQLSTRVYRRQR